MQFGSTGLYRRWIWGSFRSGIVEGFGTKLSALLKSLRSKWSKLLIIGEGPVSSAFWKHWIGLERPLVTGKTRISWTCVSKARFLEGSLIVSKADTPFSNVVKYSTMTIRKLSLVQL